MFDVKDLRYTGTWLGFCVWRCLAISLPFRILLRLGGAVGVALYWFMAKRRRVTAINLRACFPEDSEQAHEARVKACFHDLGCGLAEAAIGWWCRDAVLQSRYRFIGYEHLVYAQRAQANDQSRGVILLAAHFSTLELGARFLQFRREMVPVYRTLKNKVADRWVKKARLSHYGEVIERSDTRAMLRCLKTGGLLWLAPDQDYGRKRSVFAPFFGVPAATITSVSRLAKLTGAAVVPFFHHRLPNGDYEVGCLPALDNFPSTDMTEDAARINRIVETMIRRQPTQYLWLHRRFKTRPEGEKRWY